eukprot:TRINITY_DN23310_c0_g1_i2.p1 TRINITY_DN23310_c0_g1~~TRINITY_DN23310_c0_g1_i2.p1  ORF type:complete len:153 (-),score=36.76 TRINITY_DN23310_c0_g1_i2:477-935(-)
MFGSPLVIMMAPTETPPEVPGPGTVGSLFTLFLSHPLQALCVTCNIVELEADVYPIAEEAMSSVLLAIYKELQQASNLHPSIQAMVGNPVLCNTILRLGFFEAVCRSHVHFGKSEYSPSLSPPLPEELGSSMAVKTGLKELGKVLGTGFLDA